MSGNIGAYMLTCRLAFEHGQNRGPFLLTQNVQSADGNAKWNRALTSPCYYKLAFRCVPIKVKKVQFILNDKLNLAYFNIFCT